jgi:hypothetical protein
MTTDMLRMTPQKRLERIFLIAATAQLETAIAKTMNAVAKATIQLAQLKAKRRAGE